ncbi:MFS transporter [Magnetospira sp. QH-2]|uniref:MFS transporter n=1 Tax=Magnetospira sp. (strain QH-2) TaxID=1288970 RepID=UPI0003E810E5|nr:MFS transporter [Magnetospira sp. QH-2]CCQ74293.1 Major facilitator superfamily, general substrate transporter [Magnetospira sp. QH-2]
MTAQAEPSGHAMVYFLAAAQALAMTGASLVVTVSALAGKMLAPTPDLATMPFAFQFVGTMLATIPANLFMARVGRRVGFSIGQGIGICGALCSAAAIYMGDFWLFTAGSLLIGIHNSFWAYYRFAAAESVDAKFRPRAISYVMAGGVVAAVAGPQLAKESLELLAPVLFAGSYLAFACLAVVTILVLQFVRVPTPHVDKKAGGGRPLKEIAKQPEFIVAVLSSTLGYGVMSLVMTATPLAMVACGFAFEDAAFVIQWHVLGMFAPSFFTGALIRKFGVLKIILTGTLLNGVCMGMNLMGIELLNFWVALVALGIGWNFMFIGGTTLLTGTYEPEERAKVQSANDFTVFTMVALASFSSGALQNLIGWEAVNAAASLPILIAFAAVVWLWMTRKRLRTSVS